MSCLVAFGFLLDAACKCFGDVYTGLVGNAEKYPKDVRDFFFNVVFLSFLKDWSPYLRAITRASSLTSSVNTAILVSSLK